MPTPGPSRKEREREQHRQEILSAALELFAEKGFHNVSMQEIATAAEFATGTLYNFFPSKEDLFFELLVSTAEKSLGIILPVLDGSEDEREKLSRFIRQQERIIREHRKALRLYVLEGRGRCLPGPRVEAKKKEIDERIVSQLSKVIAAGVSKGLLNDVDPVMAAKCLSNSLESLILAAVHESQAIDVNADLAKLQDVFFRGLIKP
ncbi:MAG TPA: TetR/AcrR family transcriptional regulator [Sedimentisphaerales bacterium]|nr:TetR/AcrR family transcriptional regulator [Phycisphaerae bacterium]HQG48484.1 TetR/AcrR family transcriptional regulator [Sedimentisphaerales bacterium]HQI26750.1 TetR/AcrR family transcriptional regulator [Sedimentisphaerales bacterium]